MAGYMIQYNRTTDVFSEGKLQRDSVVANFATTAVDEKTYHVDYYTSTCMIGLRRRMKVYERL